MKHPYITINNRANYSFSVSKISTVANYAITPSGSSFTSTQPWSLMLVKITFFRALISTGSYLAATRT